MQSQPPNLLCAPCAHQLPNSNTTRTRHYFQLTNLAPEVSMTDCINQRFSPDTPSQISFQPIGEAYFEQANELANRWKQQAPLSLWQVENHWSRSNLTQVLRSDLPLAQKFYFMIGGIKHHRPNVRWIFLAGIEHDCSIGVSALLIDPQNDSKINPLVILKELENERLAGNQQAFADLLDHVMQFWY